MGTTDSLAGLARPLLADAGLDLWDIEVGPSLVRILVDRPDGVDLDALSAATAALSPLLDEREDLVPAGRYDLEVSSPGVERTLRTVDQYRRYIGSLVALKTTAAIGGSRRQRATLVAVVDDAIEVVIDGSPQSVTVHLDQVERAHTILEWGPKDQQALKAKAKASRATGKKPTGNKLTGKKPTGNKLTGKKPTGNKLTGSKPTGNKQSGSNRRARLAEAARAGADDDKDSAS